MELNLSLLKHGFQDVASPHVVTELEKAIAD
jgi:hypothetical protein